MLDQRQLYLAAFHDAAVAAQAIERLGGQIALLQKCQGQVFGERGIGCGDDECIGGAVRADSGGAQRPRRMQCGPQLSRRET